MNEAVQKERSLISKEIFGKVITALGKEKENIVVCDTDLMRCFGTKAFSEQFPSRHINFGIAEQNCMAAAAGLALSGKNVFASSFANFASKRACDQVSIAVAYNRANVKVCGLYAGLTAEKNGGTHIGVEDVALMRSIPDLCVIEPADTYELEAVTRFLAEYEGPVYFRQPKMYIRSVYEEVPDFELGKGVTLRGGSDAAVIACGITAGIAVDAAQLLQKEGIDVRVINMPTIKPLDEEIIQEAAVQTGRIVTCENHSVIGGLGSAAAEVLAGMKEKAVLHRMGIQDTFGVTASLDYQLKKNGLTAENIAAEIKGMLAD
ncbi:transketolase family protein [[Clostridium] hylemonae]|uniref:Transketolase, C-terminal domain protein n=1 Tax=[Clostridium] hylemonae DSM 15053 TaxID=553973 RepID=C0C2J3_9FIRM|nr:transketolase C-terminal domain-containing protein [[Clostridium] hylemonae]EEG73617.1 Transketolase, C-terminal domain protein [[Clostridium] hylemonae DSM 15053]QEK17218.1 1-deoxy-D-xylulose-5-phosphate synthase [[Clostridium] hylemonae DSM 15053]